MSIKNKINKKEIPETVRHLSPIKTRHEARIVVLQCLYAIELSKNPVEKVIQDIIGDERREKSAGFAHEMILKITNNRKELMKEIEAKLENWDIERVALIDRLILQIGICEFLFLHDIPPKVTINEAVEIAKQFSTEKSGQFVNGVLDSILYDLKKQGRIKKHGRGLVEN